MDASAETRESTSEAGSAFASRRKIVFWGIPFFFAALLYSRTLLYDLTGDDFCCLTRAIDSGPWWSLFIGPDTLKGLLQTEHWQGDVDFDGSDVFRPALVWFFKAGWIAFGKWDAGYRLAKLLVLTLFAYSGGMLCARLLQLASLQKNGVGESPAAPKRPDCRVVAVAGCALLLNDNVQYMATMQACTVVALGAAVLVCVAALAHDRWAVGAGKRWLALATACAALAFACRENAVCILVLVFVLDALAGRKLRRTWPAWVCYAAVTLLYLGVRFIYYGGSFGHYRKIAPGAGPGVLLGVVGRTLLRSPVRLPMCLVEYQAGGWTFGGLLMAFGAAILWLAAARGWPASKRFLLLLAGCFLSLGPGFLMGFYPQHVLLPLVLLVALLLSLTVRARAPARSHRLRRALGGVCVIMWAGFCYPSAHEYIEWGVVRRLDMKAQRVRREIKEKVLALDGAAPGPKLFILLFGPVNERFNLFENTFGPAVRVWTDGRSAGHTVFCMRPLGKRAEMRLLAPAPDEVVLQSRGVTFLPPQAWRMGERLWSDAVNVELAEPWDRTGLFEARVRVKSEYARRFRRTYMIAHDGSRFCLVDEVGGR